MKNEWAKQKGKIDDQRWDHVHQLLNVQIKEAEWWRNACLLYFQTFSKMPIPEGYPLPDKTLDYYKGLRFQYAPGK